MNNIVRSDTLRLDFHYGAVILKVMYHIFHDTVLYICHKYTLIAHTVSALLVGMKKISKRAINKSTIKWIKHQNEIYRSN